MNDDLVGIGGLLGLHSPPSPKRFNRSKNQTAAI